MKTYINSLYEPAGYYYDGLKLWVIYPMKRSRRSSNKLTKQRYWKLPVDCIDGSKEGQRIEFKSYHKMISIEEAEDRFPEYFI